MPEIPNQPQSGGQNLKSLMNRLSPTSLLKSIPNKAVGLANKHKEKKLSKRYDSVIIGGKSFYYSRNPKRAPKEDFELVARYCVNEFTNNPKAIENLLDLLEKEVVSKKEMSKQLKAPFLLKVPILTADVDPKSLCMPLKRLFVTDMPGGKRLAFTIDEGKLKFKIIKIPEKKSK